MDHSKTDTQQPIEDAFVKRGDLNDEEEQKKDIQEQPIIEEKPIIIAEEEKDIVALEIEEYFDDNQRKIWYSLTIFKKGRIHKNGDNIFFALYGRSKD